MLFAEHPVRSYHTISPLPRKKILTNPTPVIFQGGIFSVALSVLIESYEPPVLRGTLPCGVRTFLPPKYIEPATVRPAYLILKAH